MMPLGALEIPIGARQTVAVSFRDWIEASPGFERLTVVRGDVWNVTARPPQPATEGELAIVGVADDVRPWLAPHV
jgi:hypothetical protein